MTTDTKITFDAELVDLYVDEYKPVAQGLYPDLEQALSDGSMGYIEEPNVSDKDMRDALEDCMTDRIYDGERRSDGTTAEWTEEWSASIREAARRIAIHFCGKPEDDDELGNSNSLWEANRRKS
jgi:hypothetical protein